MAITDPLVLPADTVLAPVAGLPENVRNRLEGQEGDYALSRPLLRSSSRILDARSAALVAAFWSPRTIVEAVLLFSRERELDPEATLTEAFPLLESLLSAGFLVEAGSAEAAGILASFAPGDEVGDWSVVGAVQVVEDSEIYQARRPLPDTAEELEVAAVKVERRPGGGGVGWDREAAALERLALLEGAGRLVPRLLGRGEMGGRRWLAIEWWPGVHAAQAAAELRQLGDRGGLLALCRSLARAYAALHERGVVHGDVHPRNVLVGAGGGNADAGGMGGIVLVDFGLARWEGQPAQLAPRRGGVAFFFEPEYARAVLAGAAPPAASPAGEQHAVAALLYLLLTGVPYRDLSLERHEMLRQIAEDPPLPFAGRGAEPWPEMEAVLARALSKEPAERFGSMAELARALEQVEVPDTAAVPEPRPAPPALRALLGRVMARIGPDGEPSLHPPPPPPRVSIQNGAAGLAVALYRCALLREDPALLSQADAWALGARSARREAGDEAGFLDSVYHGPAGPACAQALIALAGGDRAGWRDGVERLSQALPAFEDPGKALDLVLGRPGWLLAAAMLLQAGRTAWAEEAAVLRGLGGRLLADLWRELEAEPPIPHPVPAESRLRNLGMAHGWAGALYATLRWCSAAAVPRPAGLERRLAELAGEALRWGRGLRWPWRDPAGSPGEIVSMPGWCNGSAGFVYLWTLAHRELGDGRWARLAEGAAWNAWEAPEEAADLCCGLAGRAYALLEIYRHAGGPQWLERARHLAGKAAERIAAAELPDSLYKGEVGVALLAVDLERPEEAAFPFFGDEGWP